MRTRTGLFIAAAASAAVFAGGAQAQLAPGFDAALMGGSDRLKRRNGMRPECPQKCSTSSASGPA